MTTKAVKRVSPNKGKTIEPEPGYLTVDEVAERLRCSYTTIVRLVDKGLLPGSVNVSVSVKNKRYRIPETALAKFESSRVIGK